MRTSLSKNGVLVRLPDERWIHIADEHSELAGHLDDVLETVEHPDSIYEGSTGELLAVRELNRHKYLVVVYRETSTTDGFVDHGLSDQAHRSDGEEEAAMAPELKRIVDLTPELLHVPSGRMWSSYDQEADVLYINFKKPSHADDSEILENDVLVRYQHGEVVGITVLNASRRPAGGESG